MVDRIIFTLTLALAGAYLYATEQLPTLEIGDPLGPKAFPRLLVVGLIITAIVYLLEILRARKFPVVARQPDPAERRGYFIVAAAVAWTLMYFIAFEPLGYVVATSIYLIVLTAYFNRGRWTMNVLTSVLFCVGSYLMFTKVLGVTLAPGILPF